MGAEESNRSYVKESCLYAAEKISQTRIKKLLASVWGVAAPIIGLTKNVTILIIMFSVFLAIFLVWFIIIAIKSYRKIFNGSFNVAIVEDREIIIRRNDFQKNMSVVLDSLDNQALDKFVFVMGIDKSGNLGVSTGSGVVFSVLKYLNANYTCMDEINETITPQESIQGQLNNYLGNKKKRSLSYGESVNIDMTLSPKGILNRNNPKPCHLILIANSLHVEKNGQDELKGGKYSSRIVPCVFDHLCKTGYSDAMIGVMGTNRMFQRYQVIFSQIINQFARLCYSNETHLKKLYISIRENDYEKSKVTLSQLVKYVRQCADYYARWNEA